MDYNETLDYLYSQLPMFHRVGAAAYKPNLDNTEALCRLLDHPEKTFKSIHVAGTNGKGSTSHMLAAILQAEGYKTGLYTSPHLIDFRERIRINGEMIPMETVTAFVEKYKADFENIHPSFFEMTVGLSFDHFRREQVDIAVIETGLGGRLDSTNVIQPLVSVITNIGHDHMNLLGDTLQKVAFEKAGIIKHETPVVIGETQPETESIFRGVAKERHASIFFADQLFKTDRVSFGQTLKLDMKVGAYVVYKDLEVELTGIYQLKNILTVLQTLEELKRMGVSVSEQAIRKGLKNIKSTTGLRGRWETLSLNPLTICDTGHNKEGILEVLKAIKRTTHKHLHFVLGMVSDKDISSILALLPGSATYYFCQAQLPRALDKEQLKKKALEKGLTGETYSSVKEALRAARERAAKEDLVFVGGSTFVVGEALIN